MKAAPTIAASDIFALESIARGIRPGPGLDGLLRRAGAADFVLIGEATHGTREFYETRADLTRRLVENHGFTAIALEADWLDCLRAHRYAEGDLDDPSPEAALSDFKRFPQWVWRNEIMPPFLAQLQERNRSLADSQVGIFGMDIYSLHASIAAILSHLDTTDTESAAAARERYACFDHFDNTPHAYGCLTARGDDRDCQNEVLQQLVEMRARRMEDRGQGSFFAFQNARVIADAEAYYRALFSGGDESWDIRNSHMADTVSELSSRCQQSRPTKVVIWAHNSHLGDARATEMGRRGSWNLGQLLRQKYPGRVFSIGFSTYSGTVTAARDWDGPPETMKVTPALEGSYEHLFHHLDCEPFWLDLTQDVAGVRLLRQPRLQRAIGVIYRPATERLSHYYEAVLPAQFDALIHIDKTTAIRPLDKTAGADSIRKG